MGVFLIYTNGYSLRSGTVLKILLIFSFHFHKNLMRYAILLSPFDRRDNCRSDKCKWLCPNSQLVRGKARMFKKQERKQKLILELIYSDTRYPIKANAL